MMTNNQIISLDKIVMQGKGNIISNMGGEKIMLSVQQGKYYNLGEIGGDIWDLLDGKLSIQQLVSELLSEYDVEKTVCEEQVISFLELLQKEGLITIADLENS
ncbi:MAG: lasso peptide biosynthesis PqqD family chaperone [Bacillus sp. (in: Bacteria)]|nr:lasso peptide biosynthesis PqqD family chaperone [Bacillus sp. (in: firmicutes)]